MPYYIVQKKESSFLPNPAGPDSNLTLSLTLQREDNLRSEITEGNKQKKGRTIFDSAISKYISFILINDG
jgi:hypothetical protein